MSKPHETIGKLLAALAGIDRDDATVDDWCELTKHQTGALIEWIDAGRPMLPVDEGGIVLAKWREGDDGRLFRAERCYDIGFAYGTVWNVAGVWHAVYWPTGGLDNDALGRFESRGKAKAAVDARLIAEGFVLTGGAA